MYAYSAMCTLCFDQKDTKTESIVVSFIILATYGGKSKTPFKLRHSNLKQGAIGKLS